MMGKELWPQLRFPEFKEHWKKNKLGDVARFSKGKNVSKDDVSEDGVNDCIRYGELYTTYNETISEVFSKTNLSLDESVLSQANDVIIPASGETQIDIATASCVLREGVILGGDLNIIRTANSGVFLSYYLNNKGKHDIARLSQGSSVVHLYSKQLSRLKINFPTLPEQQKIASFLTTVDKKITQLTKKKTLVEEYKKGVLQKLFSQKIRFKDDDGKDYPDWEKRTLGELLKYEQPTKYLVKSTDYNNNYRLPVLTAGKSFYLGYTNETEGIFTDIPVIIFDDFTTANKFVDFNFKVKSSAMKILKPASDFVNLKYVYEAMQMINYPRGDEHKRFWISEYSEIKIGFPSLKEQTKIADFLSAIDNKVTQVESQIEKTTAFKKGLLHQMFV